MYSTQSNRAAVFEKQAARNAEIIHAFGHPEMCKEAIAGIENIIRTNVYEDSWCGKILPAETITQEDLDRHPSESKPYKVVSVQPQSVGALSVQFGTMPNTLFLDQRRFAVYFNRILTPMYVLDTKELLSYDYDVRQILIDSQYKLIEMERDRRFIQGVDSALRTVTALGIAGNGLFKTPQYRYYEQGFTREALVDSTQIMPSGPGHITPAVGLVNTKTWAELAKWSFDETGGGTMAADILRNGMQDDIRMGIKFIVSIKNELLPDGTVYYFAEPNYLGRHYVLEPITLYVKQEAFMAQWFSYEMSGIGIGNLGGIACAEFNPTGVSSGGSVVTFS